MAKKSKAVFNPEGLYVVGPQGLWVENLTELPGMKYTGPIYLPPGTSIGYDPELLGEDNDDA